MGERKATSPWVVVGVVVVILVAVVILWRVAITRPKVPSPSELPPQVEQMTPIPSEQWGGGGPRRPEEVHTPPP